MRFTHLETLPASVLVAPDVAPGSPQVNKFGQVFSDHHPMSLAERARSDVQGYLTDLSQGVPYHVTYPMMHLMLPIPLWTDKCLWKHYLPAKVFASSNEEMRIPGFGNGGGSTINPWSAEYHSEEFAILSFTTFTMNVHRDLLMITSQTFVSNFELHWSSSTVQLNSRQIRLLRERYLSL